MNAKRFFYVAAGILMLAVAYHLGAQSAKAARDETLTGPIVGSAGWVFYTSNGEAWDVGVHGDLAWRPNPSQDLPVPASQVKFITRDYDLGIRLITKTGVAWVHESPEPGGSTPWINLGPFPGQPIQVQSMSMSDVKSAYRK